MRNILIEANLPAPIKLRRRCTGFPSARGLVNPYLDFFQALPNSCKRDPMTPPDARELLSPAWLAWKAAVAGHFAWAVPTEAAIRTILRHTSCLIEIGCGSGYWAWLLQQAGADVLAFDAKPPCRTWTNVRRGDARAVQTAPGRALLLCWPPWGSLMADDALRLAAAPVVIHVGEWMGGTAEPGFFERLAAGYVPVETVALPQWLARSDWLSVWRRRPMMSGR